MKYFVSDTKELPNKYGKWFWYADKVSKTTSGCDPDAQQIIDCASPGDARALGQVSNM